MTQSDKKATKGLQNVAQETPKTQPKSPNNKNAKTYNTVFNALKTV